MTCRIPRSAPIRIHAHGPRFPDFLLIGSMKSGTTTLFQWLGQHPRVTLPRIKEPRFFSDERVWRRKPEWYASLFAHVGPAHVTGEASVAYTDPALAHVAAKRVRRILPDVRLLCVLRDPVERLRSHYRHQVQRGRERQEFLQVVCESGNPYVARSHYVAALEPWLTVFPREQLCVVRSEDLFDGSGVAWQRILGHLGLPAVPQPTEAWNVTSTKATFTPTMRRLYDTGLHRPFRSAPTPLRRLARRALLRDDDHSRALRESSRAPLPDWLGKELTSDALLLSALLDDPGLQWLSHDPHAAGRDDLSRDQQP